MEMNLGSQKTLRNEVKDKLFLSSEETSTELCRKPRSSKVMTLKKLNEQIRLGFGQGHGSRYQPWLKIRRKNSSPNSNQVVAWMPPLGRTAHYFSRGEYHTALTLLWLGVCDLREQYPLWPIAHPHPMEGARGAENMKFNWSRGLLEIAHEAGIEHGVEFGTKIPYTATIDMLAMAPMDNGMKLVGISSKPIVDHDDEVKGRTLERLELERRYFEEINAGYFVTSSGVIPGLMAGQLEWWLDCSNLHCAPELIPMVEFFADRINKHNELSIAELVTEASSFLSIKLDAAWLLFKHCAWSQKIDIDPTIRVLTSHPVRHGGIALRSKLRQKFFGGDWK
jgi:hypothetical protein